MLLGKAAQDALERMCEVDARVRAQRAWERMLLKGLAEQWGPLPPPPPEPK